MATSDLIGSGAFAFSVYKVIGSWLQYRKEKEEAAIKAWTLKGLDKTVQAELEQRAKSSALTEGNGRRNRHQKALHALSQIFTKAEQMQLLQEIMSYNEKAKSEILLELERVQHWVTRKVAMEASPGLGKVNWKDAGQLGEAALFAAQGGFAFIAVAVWFGGQPRARNPAFWQITEAFPLMAAEPCAFIEARRQVDSSKEKITAVLALTGAIEEFVQRQAVESLSASAGGLHAQHSGKRVASLRETLQRAYGLGPQGRSKRVAHMREVAGGADVIAQEDEETRHALLAQLEEQAAADVSDMRSRHVTEVDAAGRKARLQELRSQVLAAQRNAASQKPAVLAALAALAVEELSAGGAATPADVSAVVLPVVRSVVQMLLPPPSPPPPAQHALAAGEGNVEGDGEAEEQEEEMGAAVVEAAAGMAQQTDAEGEAEGKVDGEKEGGPAGDAATEAAADPAPVGVVGEGSLQLLEWAVQGGEQGAAAAAELVSRLRAAADKAGTAAAQAKAAAKAEAKAKAAEQAAEATGEGQGAEAGEQGEGGQEEGIKGEEEEEAEQEEEEDDEEDVVVVVSAALSSQEADARKALSQRVEGELQAALSAASDKAQATRTAAALADDADVAPAERRVLAALEAKRAAAAAGVRGGDALLVAVRALLRVTAEGGAGPAVAVLHQLAEEVELIDRLAVLALDAQAADTVEAVKEYISKEGVTPEEGVNSEDVDTAKVLLDRVLSDGLVQLRLEAEQYKTMAEVEGAVMIMKGEAQGTPAGATAQLRSLLPQLAPLGAALHARLQGVAEDNPHRAAMQEELDIASAAYAGLQELCGGADAAAALRAAGEEVSAALAGLALEHRGGSAAAERVTACAGQLHGLLDTWLQAAEKAEAHAVDAGADASQAPQFRTALKDAQQQLVEAETTWAEWEHHVALREAAVRPEGLLLMTDTLPPELEEAVHESTVDMLTPLNAGGSGPNGVELLSLLEGEEEEREDWQNRGYTLMARGRVAVVMLADLVDDSGRALVLQQTGLASGKSQLRLWAERILRATQNAAQHLYGAGSMPTASVHWVLVTSGNTHGAVLNALSRAQHFGLNPAAVHVVRRGAALAPALDDELGALTARAGRIVAAPASSGDVLLVLKASGVLSRLGSAGVELLQLHLVGDNLLALPAEPVLLGAAAQRRADVLAVVASPMDATAVLAAHVAALGPQRWAEARSGTLPVSGTYVTTLKTARTLADACAVLPPRLVAVAPPPPSSEAPPQAQAARPLGPGGRPVAVLQQQQAAAAPPFQYWPQRYFTDALDMLLHRGLKVMAVEADLLEYFAPVRGYPPFWPVADPEAAVGQLMDLHTSWVESAGGEVLSEAGVEVSPLVSLYGEGLQELCAGQRFAAPHDDTLQGARVAAHSAPGGGLLLWPFGATFLAALVLRVLQRDRD